MRANQVDQALRKKFIDEGERLVFWVDEKKEFRSYIDKGLPEDLVGVSVLDLDEVGELSAKLLLEREDTEGKYLVYRTGEITSPEEDWLLDICLYSAEFHADVASVWLEELGLSSLFMRAHLKERAAFLNNQERRKKLARMVTSDDDEAALDFKMMAVLAGCQVPDFSLVLRAICNGLVAEGQLELGLEPATVETFDKMGLADRFWDAVKAEFGYAPQRPTIAGMLRHFFVSDLLHGASGPPIAAFQQYALPPRGRQNAEIFLAHWRDSSGEAAHYDAAAHAVARDIKLQEHLSDRADGDCSRVFTFWEIETRVAAGLKARVLSEGGTVDVEEVSALATNRKAGHWLSGPGRDADERRTVADAYDAIVAAAELFSLVQGRLSGFGFDTGEELLKAYQADLYVFDQLYRRFYTKAQRSLGGGSDRLKDLAEQVERTYEEGFLTPLSIEWTRLLKQDGFLADWKVPDVVPQHDFYAEFIQPYLDQADRSRAYVIISDALRYEAAWELVEKFNGQYRTDAKMDAMLGVLPSYTALGMASLLPHDTLAFTDSADVLVNGKAVAGTDARAKHLGGYAGIACQAKDMLAKTRDQARDLVRDFRLVYIYHDIIDAGSHATEGATFQAVDQCIADLGKLVQYCVNHLNADRVWVTADHGFLFQHTSPDETDKTSLGHKPNQTIKAKKRYVMGRGLGSTPEALHGTTRVTAGTEDDMEFWLPHGTDRFHFSGGARFVHGGAMPQEVVIPVVTVKRLRGKQAAKSKVEKVSVQVLGTKHKITTPMYRFEIIQLEPVSERRLPITLRAAVFDGSRPVTSVDTVTLDSDSNIVDERKKSVRLKLSTGDYDKTKPYRLVLRDADTDAEIQAVPVQIDRTFDDDF